MIRIFLGNVGSGKTLSCVKELVDSDKKEYKIQSFSNIITKKKGKYAISKNSIITKEMLIKKEVKKIKKDGSEEYKLTFNVDVWKQLKQTYKAFDIIIDEAHTLFNARNHMSTKSRVMNDFLSLIRKICSDPQHDSTLTLISQLDNRIDINARELATEVRYHIAIWEKVCKKCNAFWSEHSDLPDFKKHKECPACKHHVLKKFNYRIIVYFFKNMDDYRGWKYNGIETFVTIKKYLNVERYFNYYDTFQLDDLISEDD